MSGQAKEKKAGKPRTATRYERREDYPWAKRFRATYKVLTEENVAEGLKRYRGNQSAVARSLGVTSAAVSRFVLDRPHLREIAEAARMEVIDRVEYNLFLDAEAGDRWAMDKVLNSLARGRGYGHQVALTGPTNPDGTAGPVAIQIVLPDNFRGPVRGTAPLEALEAAEAILEEFPDAAEAGGSGPVPGIVPADPGPEPGIEG